MTPEKSNKIWTFVGIGLLIPVIYFEVKYSHDIEKLVMNAGLMAPLLMVFLYAILAPTPITSDPLTLLSGILFGPFFGTLISFIGNTLAATIEYFVGVHVGKRTSFHEYKERLPFGLGKFPVDSPWFLILARLIPSYGGKVVSFIAGVYRVPIKKYIWTTAITNLLGSLFLAFGGSQLIHLLKF